MLSFCKVLLVRLNMFFLGRMLVDMYKAINVAPIDQLSYINGYMASWKLGNLDLIPRFWHSPLLFQVFLQICEVHLYT